MGTNGPRYRAALIGCGRIGVTFDEEVKDKPNTILPASHASSYATHDQVDLVAAADIDSSQLAIAQERFDIPGAYQDYREMIHEEDPDIVSVATRPGSHRDMVCFAAENGVQAIYCEKPLCQSMEEAHEIEKACEQNDVHFNLGTGRRYKDVYRVARDLISDGLLGDPQAIIGEVGASSTMWGHSHAVDMISFLNDDTEVEWVQGEADFDGTDIEDDRLLIDPTLRSACVQFSNDVRGYLVQSDGWEFTVDGADGKLRLLNDGYNTELRYRQGEWDILKEDSFPPAELDSGPLRCVEELVAALHGDGSTTGSIDAAVQGTEMCLGLLESERRNGERVELPLQNRQFSVAPDHW